MTRLQDDFYTAINEKWLAETEIPSDRPRIGSFDELGIKIEKTELADFGAMRDGETPAGLMGEFIKFYRLASDWTKRDADGAVPLKPWLAKVTALNNLQDLQANLLSFSFQGLPTGVPAYVDQDMKNTERNILNVGSFSQILPDTTYYTDDNEQGPELLKVWAASTVKLLVMAGYDEAEATKLADDAVAFDKLAVPFVLSNEEKSDYWKLYNPIAFDEFTAKVKNLDLATFFKALVDGEPDIVNVGEVKFWDHYDEIVNEANFSLMKASFITKTVRAFAGYLSEEMRQEAGVFGRTMSGTEAAPSQEKAALRLAHGAFDPVVGDYYGRKYFGETAKADVLDMVKKMIAVYENRLAQNTWLSEATKQKAVLKLSTIGLNVGYPDKIPARYSQFIVDEDASLLDNALKFSEFDNRHAFAQFKEKPNTDEWEMPADMVNAYYHPFHNIIVFPAAILQAPFYSLEQSKSANYGGIGAVIAHEISHAFDTNGARFDEKGNLNSWWTDEDFAAFEKRSEAMINEFDGLEISGAKINGHLVVSENVADVGGMSAALEAAKGEDEVNLADFFGNWATVWRNKANDDFMKLMAAVDVHAPAPLRANVQVSNFEDFFVTFNVTADDGMWRAPADRVQIW
ncbi:M13 family peptidase [Periweissella cryptocerci]|uniref:M13 family peptidase n=1 Tax=Periweissella cryptocerci TaxID=2506420 RepID=A0A4P6YUT7_9LACO|nr:M13-type metalloendopeptidase [Periweissella cryptocerci]QBO36522.1 M13 family peptidase [Periweissella cryptocerci]